MHEYENTRRITLGNGAQFVPVCIKCSRFVKADKEINFYTYSEELVKRPNATCAKCGRVEMMFEGFF